jgi:hypothetical protein
VERQAMLDQAFDAHPERFPRGRLVARQPAREVWINKPKATDRRRSRRQHRVQFAELKLLPAVTNRWRCAPS